MATMTGRPDEAHLEPPDRPWMIRTYSGHSTARASNELYRSNLAKGQTGLSIAFDLPTQTGYDPDHVLARGEVGKVGVPVAHLGHMSELLDGIPVGRDEHVDDDQRPRGVAARPLRRQRRGPGCSQQGTPGHDAERHREGVPVPRHVHLPAAALAPADRRHDRVLRRVGPDVEPDERVQLPPAGGRGHARCRSWPTRWPPPSGCSTRCKESGQVAEDRFPQVFASISFFVNSGIRFVEETAKMRAFTQLWDRIGLERYGVTDPKARRFRYGVQVNSLGLTEAQPENNVQRIVLEMLGVTLSRDARARSIQLPAWNEALGLPRPWDQQWALRMQQVLAYETDLLEYPDLFEGSKVIEAPHRRAGRRGVGGARGRAGAGGAFEAIDELKGRLVASHAERMRRIESGDLPVVGVNRFTEALPSPLEGEGSILRVDPAVEAETIAGVEAWRARARRGRGEALARGAAAGGREPARTSCRPRSTWPTPVAPPASGPACCARCSASTARPPAWPPRRASAAAARACGPSPTG